MFKMVWRKIINNFIYVSLTICFVSLYRHHNKIIYGLRIQLYKCLLLPLS